MSLNVLFEVIFPKISDIIFLCLFVFGTIWGIFSLSHLIPKYFETIGGGLLIGGTIGTLLGILLGAEILRRQNEENFIS